MEEIAAWLEGEKDFSTGLKLYEKYGTSQSFKRILSRSGFSVHNHQNLVYELSKLKVTPTKLSRPSPPPSPVKSSDGIPAKKFIDFSKDPPEIIEFKNKLVLKLKERDACFYRLSENMPQGERASFCKRILDISDEISDMYVTLDKFNKHGTPIIEKQQPKPVEPSPLDPSIFDGKTDAELSVIRSKLASRRSKSQSMIENSKSELIVENNRLKFKETDDLIKLIDSIRHRNEPV